MGDSLPAVCAGAILAAVGLGMGWFQWRYRQPPHDENPLARLHARRQLRRRLQISGLMILVGTLIPLGDLLPFFRKAPLAFALYWIAILVLMGWMVLLALGDLASAQIFHQRTRQQLRQQQAELERELHRLRNAQGDHSTGNGHAGPRPPS